MKVLAGTLTDADRAIIFESNRTGRRVLVHTDHYCPHRGHRHAQCAGNDCMVGVVTGWTHDSFTLGGWSFSTNVPWESARIVRWRDEVSDDERCPVDTCASNLRAIERAA